MAKASWLPRRLMEDRPVVADVTVNGQPVKQVYQDEPREKLTPAEILEGRRNANKNNITGGK